MSTETKRIETKKSRSKQNGSAQSGSRQIVTEATVLIPLEIVYERCQEFFDGGIPQRSKIRGDSHFAVITEKRQDV